MKKVIIFGTALLIGSYVFADKQFPSIPEMEKPMNQMTKAELKAFYAKRRAAIEALPKEQQEAYREKQKADRIAYAGGIVRKSDGKGRIIYANLQDAVSINDIQKTMSVLAKYLKIRIDTLNVTKEEANDVKKLLHDQKAQAVVIIVDNPLDPSLLVAPEDKWAKINIGKFKDQNAAHRTQMELLRAFCFLCGGIGSEYSNPLTGYVSSPAQLDDSPVAQLPMDVVNRFTPYLKQLGIVPYVEATYRKACREGWAPAPTNDVQKAIWDKVHALPQKPMKIEFDAKKGR